MSQSRGVGEDFSVIRDRSEAQTCFYTMRKLWKEGTGTSLRVLGPSIDWKDQKIGALFHFLLLPTSFLVLHALSCCMLAYLHGKTNTTSIKLMKKQSFPVLPSTVSDIKISLGLKFKGPLKALGGALGSNTHPRLISDGLREDSYIPGAKYLLVFLTFPVFSICPLKRMLL